MDSPTTQVVGVLQNKTTGQTTEQLANLQTFS